MRASTYQWQQNKVSSQEQKEIQNLSQVCHCSLAMSQILWQRGIQTPDQFASFMHPSLEQLHDPFLFKDMTKAVARIMFAIEQGQRILIYGDYDCDGISGTVVLKDVLEGMGAEVEYFLPDRIEDGYGPNLSVYKYYIQSGIDLIITVDNGITGFEALAYAKEQDVDVIITDHHEMKESLPEAYAILHPRLADQSYPEPYLSGVGVAFKLACALVQGIPMEVLDMVALGTIADLVPLEGENRTLVALGIQALRQSDRLGWQALMEVSGLRTSDLDSEMIAFQIAPRLNAAGRLAQASLAVDLLTSFDADEAKQLAEQINYLNEKRKKLVQKASAEALTQLTSDKVQVLASEEWPEGIVGIIAGKVCEKTGKACIVLHIDPLSGVAKGSARSREGLALNELFERHQDLLLTAGGHAVAAGLSLEVEQIAAFRKAVNEDEVVQHWQAQKPKKNIDLCLRLEECTLDLYKELQQLAPFGQANEVPKIQLVDVQAENLRQIGQEKQHLKGRLVQAQTKLDFIYFNFPSSLRDFYSTNHLQVYGKLSTNTWNEQTQLQLMVEDYQIDTLQVYDARGQRWFEEDFIQADACFVYFNPLHLRKLKQLYPTLDLRFYEEVQVGEQVVLLDIPSQREALTTLIQNIHPSSCVLVAHAFEEAYLNGMPSRTQFTEVFRFLKQQKDMPVRKQLPQLSQFFKIPMQNVIFMLNLFRDLDFVQIEDGILNPVQNPVKRELSSSPLYREREMLIENEAFFLYENMENLCRWFQQQEEKN